MKQIHACIWVIGMCLIFWPAWGWAAPRSQEGGTIPLSPPESLGVLTIQAITTVPQDVVINEPFDLVVNILNANPFAINDLVVTYRDLADDQALTAVAGTKTDTVRGPGPFQGIGISKTLRYLVFLPSRREIEVRFDYTYVLDGQVIAATQTANIVFLVVAPTPTPTITWTPTPTFTPAPDLVATFEFIRNRDATATAAALTLTPTSTPAPPVIIVVPPAEPERGENLQATSTPSDETIDQASVGSGSSGPTRSALVVEFEDVPLTVYPGELFSMTLVVRNISTATVSAVVATWETFDKAIVPIGAGTRWYLNGIRPGDKQSVSGRFYVQEGTANGIQQVEVRVDYRDATRPADGEVNILVQAAPVLEAAPTPSAAALPPLPVEEPLWIRVLRSLFGAPNP